MFAAAAASRRARACPTMIADMVYRCLSGVVAMLPGWLVVAGVAQVVVAALASGAARHVDSGVADDF